VDLWTANIPEKSTVSESKTQEQKSRQRQNRLFDPDR
jgi:hypothetical protein